MSTITNPHASPFSVTPFSDADTGSVEHDSPKSLMTPFSDLPESVRNIFEKVNNKEMNISKISWNNILMEDAVLLAIFIVKWCPWVDLGEIPVFIADDNRFVDFLLNQQKDYIPTFIPQDM